MKEINKEQLNNLYGGATSITGQVLNAVVNVYKILKDAGYSMGSGIRRISEDNLCPLE
jgi:hypothetical protein